MTTIPSEGDYSLDGVRAIIDHKLFPLCAVADMIAALSCEASGAVISAFISAPRQDVSTLTSCAIRRRVAFDFWVLLKGSKLVGKHNINGVSCIPTVHGSLRKELNRVQLRTRVTLETTQETWLELLHSLMIALLNYGKSSLSRALSNVESVRDNTMRSSLRHLVKEHCPNDGYLDTIAMEAANEQYARFLNLIDKLAGLVRAVLSWEMTTALVSLEAELHLPDSGVMGDGVDDENPNSGEKKRELMGSQTGAVLLFIEDRLDHFSLDGPDQPARLLRLAKFCELVLTPTEKESQNFARLLDIPRDIPYCMAFHPFGERRRRGSIIPANLGGGNVVGLVDCGADSPNVLYCEGKVWCEGGYTISADVPLSDIYQNARYGRFKYHFALSSGFYSVSLYFAETLNVEAHEGIRVFDVRINGENALSGFDIGKEFGFMTPCGLIDRLVVLRGEGERLVIDFDPRVGSALVNAICIRKLPVYFGWWISNSHVSCEFCGQEIDVPIEAVTQVESDLRVKYDRELKLYEKMLETKPLGILLGEDEEDKKYYEEKMDETREYFEECRKKGKEYLELLKKQLADVKGVRLGERDILKELEEIDKIRPHS